MKQRPRIYYTESQRALMWERWQKGESLQQIAQLFDRNHSSIQRILAETGGIRPAARQPIPIGADSGGARGDFTRSGSRAVVRSIAAELGRAPSSISREIGRNGGRRATGRPGRRSAWERRRPKPCKLVPYPALARLVAEAPSSGHRSRSPAG